MISVLFYIFLVLLETVITIKIETNKGVDITVEDLMLIFLMSLGLIAIPICEFLGSVDTNKIIFKGKNIE